jgi:hypothetical protein
VDYWVWNPLRSLAALFGELSGELYMLVAVLVVVVLPELAAGTAAAAASGVLLP